MASLASLDGEIMPADEAMIPATDEGLLRGDGVFEVIRVYDGKPFAIEDHLTRLERSATNLRLPIDVEAVRADAHRLLAEAGPGPDHDVLRIVLTRGGRRLLLTEPMHDTPERIRLGSITYSPTRILDGVKSLSYGGEHARQPTRPGAGLRRGAARHPARPRPRGADELDLLGLGWPRVHAAARRSRPRLDHPRDRDRAHGRASSVRARWTISPRADEAFLASTIREVQPVAAVNEISFERIGPVTSATAEAFSTRVQAELSSA